MDIKKIFRKILFSKALCGVDMVKVGVLDRLAERFQPEYDKETADMLAAAIVNELFSETPSDHYAREFLEINRKVVERELSNLKNDVEICTAVTQAVRVKALASQEQVGGKTQVLACDLLEKLKKFGILVPTEETPNLRAFLRMANEFYQRKSDKAAQK